MRQLTLKRYSHQKGFTLIELLAVIIVLAIIMAIAIPAMGRVVENTRFKAVKSDAVNAINVANLYYANNPDVLSDVSVGQLKSENYLVTAGKIPNDSIITKDVPRKISTPNAEPITYSSSKHVSFNEATIKDINEDTKKGSEINNGEHYIIPQP